MLAFACSSACLYWRVYRQACISTFIGMHILACLHSHAHWHTHLGELAFALCIGMRAPAGRWMHACIPMCTAYANSYASTSRRASACLHAYVHQHACISMLASAGASACLHLHVHQHAYIGVFAIAYMHSHLNWQACIVIRASVCMHKRVNISVPAFVCALACAFAREHRHAHARRCINMHASACMHQARARMRVSVRALAYLHLHTRRTAYFTMRAFGI